MAARSFRFCKKSGRPESALKLIYMAISEASKNLTRPIHHWKSALNHFAIMFEDRMPELTGK